MNRAFKVGLQKNIWLLSLILALQKLSVKITHCDGDVTHEKFNVGIFHHTTV